MKCLENVIVTVCLHPGTHTLDMELPAFLPANELEKHFLDTVREMNPLHYGTMTSVSFQCCGRQITGDMTLAQAGVWDGAILDVHLSEGV